MPFTRNQQVHARPVPPVDYGCMKVKYTPNFFDEFNAVESDFSVQ